MSEESNALKHLMSLAEWEFAIGVEKRMWENLYKQLYDCKINSTDDIIKVAQIQAKLQVIRDLWDKREIIKNKKGD